MYTVLIIDDDEDSRLFLGDTVASGGYQPLFAPDGQAAFELLRKRAVDVIVTDLAMPGINGLRLIRELCESGERIPIIAVSGINADQLHLAQDYGADAALPKPVDRRQLLAWIRHLASEHDRFQSTAWGY